MKRNKQHKFKEQRKNISLEKSECTSKNNNKPTTLATEKINGWSCDYWLILWFLQMGSWILWVVGDRDWSEREKSQLKSKVLCVCRGFIGFSVWGAFQKCLYGEILLKECIYRVIRKNWFFFFFERNIKACKFRNCPC